MAQSILVIDDDPAQLRVMGMNLAAANYTTLQATNGEEGIALFKEHRPDLVILDVMMPGMDGWETCYRIRQISTVPIIFLTARDKPDDKISGLKLGADDYLVKPFMPAELLARVEAVLRRTYGARQPLKNMLRIGGEVLINRDSHEVFVRGKSVELRPTQYSLLTLLAEHANATVRIEVIARALEISDVDRARNRIKWHIWKLRQAIEADPANPNLILTDPGVGYRVESS